MFVNVYKARQALDSAVPRFLMATRVCGMQRKCRDPVAAFLNSLLLSNVNEQKRKISSAAAHLVRVHHHRHHHRDARRDHLVRHGHLRLPRQDDRLVRDLPPAGRQMDDPRPLEPEPKRRD